MLKHATGVDVTGAGWRGFGVDIQWIRTGWSMGRLITAVLALGDLWVLLIVLTSGNASPVQTGELMLAFFVLAALAWVSALADALLAAILALLVWVPALPPLAWAGYRFFGPTSRRGRAMRRAPRRTALPAADSASVEKRPVAVHADVKD
jgi:hypothetical protein